MSQPESSRILDTAIAALTTEGLLTEGVSRLEVLDERDLVRSTVRLLALTDGHGDSVRVYHKRIKPRSDSRKAETLLAEERDSLAVAAGLELKLAASLPPPRFRVGRTLAVDIETLEQVTLAVPGAHLGRLWRRGLTPAGRSETRSAVRLVGEACRTMEEIARYEGSLPDRLVGSAVIDRRVARMKGRFDDSELERLRSYLGSLEAEAMSRAGALYRSHGDLNATNVLVHADGISLIDFAWHPSLRLTDLAHFAYRLEYESGSPRQFAESLTTDLLDGYGEDMRGDPGWRFLRYSKLIRVVSGSSASRNPLARRNALRAERELRAALTDQ